MKKILCDNEECIWYVFLENEGSAYQDQCSNDEIEIGLNEHKEPICCSEELKEE